MVRIFPIFRLLVITTFSCTFPIIQVAAQNGQPPVVQIPLTFHKGWNMFSIPVVPPGFETGSFFQDKNVGSMWTFGVDGYQQTNSVEPGKAYWIFLSEELSVVYPYDPGASPTTPEITYEQGWNLYGVQSPLLPPSEAFGVLWFFSGDRFQAASRNEDLFPGFGYWINLNSAGELPQGSIEADEDNDGMPDYWESLWNLDYRSAADVTNDPDVDELMNVREYESGTNPRSADTDLDGLTDGREVNIHRSSPLLMDTDGDGFSDKEEVDSDFDPADSQRFPVTTIDTSPAHQEARVAVTRETIIRFSRALAESTVIDDNAFSAEFGGDPLAIRIHSSPDRRSVTLFYEQPLPASAIIRVSVVGDLLIDENGHAVDADGDRIAGGTGFIDFETLTLTIDENSNRAVCGRVFASELRPDGDEGDAMDMPLAGVTITIDGIPAEEIKAVTDACGNFRLQPVPLGRFFVHIDGRTVPQTLIDGVITPTSFPDGPYYPIVGKAWETLPGRVETNLETIYLPLIPENTLTSVSETEETVLEFSSEFVTENPKFDGVQVMVPPNVLFADDGTRGGMMGIAPVPPDRLPGPLPEGLGIQDVITIQTDGATNFDQPVPVCLPNLPDPETNEILPPGAESALWSFNHDTGRFEIVGSATVNEDGTLVCSDPGFGILAPGWHGTAPGTNAAGGGSDGSSPPANEKGGQSPAPGSGEEGMCVENTTSDPIDPVYLFSGEFYETVEDLRIKGRGFDFVWNRKYRSQIGPNTAQGNGWDFSYNIFIEQRGRLIRLCDGNTRDDLYHPRADGTFGRNEFFRKLEMDDNQLCTLTFADRRRWIFRSLTDDVAPGKIDRIIDRNGNQMSFHYSEDGRLIRITDTLNRDIEIAYNGNEMITSVTDFKGRVIRYEYYNGLEPGGNLGDLKSVTSPVVTGMPTGNDFPNGKTVSYTYSTGFANPRLNHNLLTITDGRRNDPNDSTFGQGPYLINIYSDETNVLDLNFDRIVRQIWGNADDIIDVTYERLDPKADNLGAFQKSILNDRNGNVKEYLWDLGNRCVLHREYTGRADPSQPTTETDNRPINKLRPNDPEFFETRYEWTEDSLRRRTIHPNGNITEYVYESDLSQGAPARIRGNLRIVRQLPGSHLPMGDQERIEEQFVYDANFGCSSCGFNFVTQHTDGRGNITSIDFDDRGNLIRRQHRIPSIVEDFEYNEFGQMTKRTWPDNGSNHRRVDRFTYYTQEEDDDQEGYLKEEIIDAENFALTTTYEYDLVGNVVRKTDPRGHDTQYVINELDQVVREISREVLEGSGVRYQRDTYYDANNNMVRNDIINRNDQGILQENNHFSVQMEYEILNYLIRQSEEVDIDHQIITEYEYDRNRNQTRIRYGEAINGNQPTNTLTQMYDERDLLFREIRAEGDSAQSTNQYDYDANKNRIRLNEGLEESPHIYQYIYDSYNRPVSFIDPMGNTVSFGYDENHNQVLERTDGEIFDVEGDLNNVRLAETNFGYDEMDRMLEKKNEFFETESGNPIQGGQLLGKSLFTMEYSDNSQVIRVVNDNEHQTLTTYDTANREHTVTDHKGNTTTYTYDENDNILTKLEFEKSDLGNSNETYTTSFAFDGLDRRIEAVDNIGNTNSFAYDSRNNRTVTIDALGNMIRYTYDGLNRLLQTTRFLTNTGAGEYDNVGENSRSRPFPDQPANTIDTITTQQTWDDTSRLASQIDDSGNITAYLYDALSRKIKDIFADGTEYECRYDVHDNKIETIDANGSRVTSMFDLRDRQVRRDINSAASVSDTTTFEIYKYDGLSRLTHIEDDDSLVRRYFDSLNNVVREELWIGDTTTLAPTGVVRSEYDGVGNEVSCTYPSGRMVTCTFDELERKKTIRDQAGLIAEYFYIGLRRMERRDYGNGTRLDITYDGLDNVTGDFGVRQMVRTSHTKIDDGSVIDDRTYRWDPLYNKTQRADIRASGPQLTHDYTYDSIYRLRQTQVTGTVSAEIRNTEYNLDGVGNRNLVTGGSNPGNYVLSPTTPDPADFQLNQYTETPSDTRQYDSNGNLVSTENVGGGSIRRQITYDYRNQMVQHTDNESSIESTYVYDALGRRISKQVTKDSQPSTVNFFYCNWQVIEEQNDAGETQATYVYGLYIDEPLNMQRNSTDYYYHADQLHNIMVITDELAAVIERYEYNDFGEIVSDTGSQVSNFQSQIFNPYLFTGRWYDSETGFYYYRTRYNDPGAGRFTTRDTIGIWGDSDNMGNGYSYVGNNSMTYLDPMGEDRTGCDGIPDWLETPCILECCAIHDECFDFYHCRAMGSWLNTFDSLPTTCGAPFPFPFRSQQENCNGCNTDVLQCFIQCAGNPWYDNPDRPNFYCAEHNTFYDLEDCRDDDHPEDEVYCGHEGHSSD